ncbi:unnamed protein product [Prorocentrum cordatum]|uniref:Uncharacterized protein n=1 Tax=Prorocentrum cordatum TaxID=2364126 RepID=A0ABN9YA04_9DINO|nr:unnamed protein product [Polarella glacialis]
MPSGSAHCRRVRPRAEAPGEEEGPVGAAAKQGVPAPAARLPPGLAAELARLGSERAVALGAAMQWQLECARHEPLAVLAGGTNSRREVLGLRGSGIEDRVSSEQGAS